MALKIIYTLSLIDMLIMGLLMPVFRPHATLLGASELQIGLLDSMTSLLMFLSGPIVGSLSDSKGRKFVLAITLILNLLAYALLGLINTFAVFTISRLLIALFMKVQIIVKAIIADVVPKEEQSACFATFGALSGIGFIAGPIVGGYLYVATNDFSYISTIVGAAILLSLGLTTLLPAEKVKKDQKEIKISQAITDVFANFRKVKWSVFWDVFLLKFLLEECFMLFYMTLGVELLNFGASQVNVGYVMAFHTVLLIASNLLIGRIQETFYKDDKEGVKQNLHGFLILALTFLGFYISPSYYVYVLFIIPISLIRSVFDASQMSSLLARTPEEEKGVMMGAFESVAPLAGFVVPLMTGVVGEMWGQKVIQLLGVPPAAIAVLVCVWLQSRKIKTN